MMIEIGTQCLQIISFSYCFYTMTTVILTILQTFKIVKIAIISSIFSCLVNIGLSLSLVQTYQVQGVAFSMVVVVFGRVVQDFVVAT